MTLITALHVLIMTCANSSGFFWRKKKQKEKNRRRKSGVNREPIGFAARFSFERQERREGTIQDFFHDPQIFFYKFKSDYSIHC